MVKKILPHICIVLGLMFIVFLIINYVNEAMNFINNGISLALNLILAVSSVVLGIMYIHETRK